MGLSNNFGDIINSIIWTVNQEEDYEAPILWIQAEIYQPNKDWDQNSIQAALIASTFQVLRDANIMVSGIPVPFGPKIESEASNSVECYIYFKTQEELDYFVKYYLFPDEELLIEESEYQGILNGEETLEEAVQRHLNSRDEDDESDYDDDDEDEDDDDYEDDYEDDEDDDDFPPEATYPYENYDIDGYPIN